MLITAVSLILIENSFQNSFASQINNTDSKLFILPFNSHIADQAKNEIAFSNNDLPPFP